MEKSKRIRAYVLSVEKELIQRDAAKWWQGFANISVEDEGGTCRSAVVNLDAIQFAIAERAKRENVAITFRADYEPVGEDAANIENIWYLVKEGE